MTELGFLLLFTFLEKLGCLIRNSRSDVVEEVLVLDALLNLEGVLLFQLLSLLTLLFLEFLLLLGVKHEAVALIQFLVVVCHKMFSSLILVHVVSLLINGRGFSNNRLLYLINLRVLLHGMLP